MLTVAIERHKDPATISQVTAETEQVFDQIRQWAHALFQQRGATEGRTVDDWLQAERAIVTVPPSELIEKNEQFVLHVAIPGLTPDQVRVRVMPNVIVIQQDHGASHCVEEGRVHFSELTRNPVFRCCQMPDEIDIKRVEASLENGILRIVAPKRKLPIRAAPADKRKSSTSSSNRKKRPARNDTSNLPLSRRGV